MPQLRQLVSALHNKMAMVYSVLHSPDTSRDTQVQGSCLPNLPLHARPQQPARCTVTTTWWRASAWCRRTSPTKPWLRRTPTATTRNDGWTGRKPAWWRTACPLQMITLATLYGWDIVSKGLALCASNLCVQFWDFSIDFSFCSLRSTGQRKAHICGNSKDGVVKLKYCRTSYGL